MLRRGALVAAERRRGETVVVDVGGAPVGSSAYQRAKFEAILRGERAMGVVAHNIGGPEAALGSDDLRRVSRKLAVPLISANARDGGGRLVAEPYRIASTAGGRLALVGVLSQSFQTADVRVTDPRQAVLDVLQSIHGRYDWLAVLAYLNEAELQALAAGLPEADLVIGGPTGQSVAPRRVGPLLLASATNKGKFILALKTPQHLGGQWTGDVVELTARFADDPRQTENLAEFRKELARRDFSAAESGLVEPPADELPGDYRLAGNAVCGECHAADHERWRYSRHALAWQTLRGQGLHVDPYCQQCHTNGYGLPGGFESARRSPQRTAVGCESCHGPSAAHAHDPAVRTSWNAQEQCVHCHDPENSPKFEYGGYWRQIQHGRESLKSNED